VRRILIVANQTIGGEQLAAAVTERLTGGACDFHLLVPVPPTPPSAIAVGLGAVEAGATAIIDLPDQREVARERLAEGLAWLHDLGADATGEVGTSDAVGSVVSVVERASIDEIIVSTLPSRLSKWLRQDLPCRIERRVDIPVTVITATADADDG
jgi:aminoglycoside phosphotransferase (APT) family kinase protein